MTKQTVKISKTVQDNGLALVHILLPYSNSSAIGAFIRTGNRHDPDSLPGLVHFVEHMLYMGTKNFKNSQKFHEEMERYGAWSEAFTFPDYTHHLIKVGNTYIPEMIGLLADLLINPSFNKKEMDEARKTIIEELYTNKSNPMNEIWNLWTSIINQGSKLERSYLGTEESLSAISQDDLINFHQNEYACKNTIFIYAGSLEENEVASLFAKYFSKYPVGQTKKAGVSPATKRTFPIKISSSEDNQITFAFGIKTEGLSSSDTEALDLLKVIIGTGWSSRLGNKLFLKNGLIYTWTMGLWQNIDNGSLVFQSATYKGNIGQVLKIIKDTYEDVRKNGITENELKRAKSNYCGDLEISIESPLDYVYWYGRQELLFPNKAESVAEKVTKIQKISQAQINSVVRKYFGKDSRYLVAIGPITDKDLRIYLN